MNYIELMRKSDEATLKAIDYLKKHEIDLAIFWSNASKGFKEKAMEILI